MEFHPIANIFPLMQGKGFDELCEDIKANGLREPIWLYQGMILDGRNRYRACEAISYTPAYRMYQGDDPYGFVGSLNVHRRHLTTSQRAMMVADLVTHSGGAAIPGEVSAAQAGALVGVNGAVVAKARALKRKGEPSLQRAVEEGRLGVTTAERVSALRPEQQRAVLLRAKASSARPGMLSTASIEQAVQTEAPGVYRLRVPAFIKDLDEMAVRLLDFFTAPQLDLLWDIIAKKQSELIAARKEKS